MNKINTILEVDSSSNSANSKNRNPNAINSILGNTTPNRVTTVKEKTTSYKSSLNKVIAESNKESNEKKPKFYLSKFFYLLSLLLFTLGVFSYYAVTNSVLADEKITANISVKHVYNNSPSVSQNASVSDFRQDILVTYFTNLNSPLKDQVNTILKYSDLNDAEENNNLWKLTAAIATCETSAGKNVPYYIDNAGALIVSNNAWNWSDSTAEEIATGIYNLYYPSYIDSISTFTKGITEEYFNKGIKSIADIANVYSPSNPQVWQDCVNTEIKKISNPTQALNSLDIEESKINTEIRNKIELNDPSLVAIQ